jgi:hypothetical protein
MNLVNSDNIEAGTGGEQTKIVIDNTSYLQIGSDVLEFHGGQSDLTLNTSTSIGSIQTAVGLNLSTPSKSNSSYDVVAHLGADTGLYVSSSYAKLLKDVTITVNGLDMNTVSTPTMDDDEDDTDVAAIDDDDDDEEDSSITLKLADALSVLRDSANDETAPVYLTVMNLVLSFDALVGAVDNGETINVNINFGT